MKALSKFKVAILMAAMAGVVAFNGGISPILANDEIAVSTKSNAVTIFQGAESIGTWQFALPTSTIKNGGTFDSSMISEAGYFYLTYTGDESEVQMILQSWSGGAGWAQVAPSEVGALGNDTYYAKFDYATMSAAYGTNFAALDKFYVFSITEPITICSLEYREDVIDPSVPTEPVEPPVVDPTEPVEPPVTDPTKEVSEYSFKATAENVKQLGRSYYYKDALWLSLSGAGVEYTFEGTKANVTILGDNVATSSWGESSRARVGIFVNDVLVVDKMITEDEQTFEILNSNVVQNAKVRIVKLSESANSTIGIKSLDVTATGPIVPTKAKNHSIEFIGDSITCGFGVDDENPNGSFTTATEDATKTYAYKTAEALDADYSLVSYSGYGVISGYTNNGLKAEDALVAPYYDKIGFSYGYFNGEIEVATLPWDFSKAQPDLIVINLGTNDLSYCGNDVAKQKEFVTGYIAFLKMVREKNPQATMLCTLGIMGDALYPAIEEAVAAYTLETGDHNVASMKFDVQSYNDGFAACYHPTEKTHKKAARKLTAEIEELMGWEAN